MDSENQVNQKNTQPKRRVSNKQPSKSILKGSAIVDNNLEPKQNKQKGVNLTEKVEIQRFSSNTEPMLVGLNFNNRQKSSKGISISMEKTPTFYSIHDIELVLIHFYLLNKYDPFFSFSFSQIKQKPSR